MHCPHCSASDTEVRDTQPNPKNNGVIRRRRRCKQCDHKFTTREIFEEQFLLLKLYMDHETISAKITEMRNEVKRRCNT